ncbi:pro-Pol polyprotein [Trichonephila clavipes]|nr:pro-Pol polyprotein [Trichonephila clavipes]
MKNASMKLRKWNSNDQTLMRTWEREGLETHPRHRTTVPKSLRQRFWGYHGMLSTTILQLMLKDFCNWTRQSPSQKKRIGLQSAGKIYDPVGFLSPYTISSNAYYKNFGYGKLKIPRKILDSSGDSSEVQIHTFSDASQKAYGAAAFLRVKHKDRIGTDGRSACCTLSEGSQENPRSEVFNQSLFLDGLSGHLTLIKGPSHRWKPFVVNRVREIQSLTYPNSWFHCSGKDNPADLLTNGISVDALTTNSKWWNGSSFLRQIDFQTKGLDEAIPERVYLTEMRKNSNPKEDISLTLTKNNFFENIIDISNNYVKLIRVVSFFFTDSYTTAEPELQR